MKFEYEEASDFDFGNNWISICFYGQEKKEKLKKTTYLHLNTLHLGLPAWKIDFQNLNSRLSILAVYRT